MCRAAQSQGLSFRVSVLPPVKSSDTHGVRAVLAAKPRAAIMSVTMRDIPLKTEPTPIFGFLDPLLSPRAMEYAIYSKRALLEVSLHVLVSSPQTIQTPKLGCCILCDFVQDTPKQFSFEK